MTFTLTIDCDNAAFEDNPASEIRRIVRKLGESQALYAIDPSDRRYGANEGTVRDGNGNTVGRWSFEPDTEPDVPLWTPDEDHGPGCMTRGDLIRVPGIASPCKVLGFSKGVRGDGAKMTDTPARYVVFLETAGDYRSGRIRATAVTPV